MCPRQGELWGQTRLLRVFSYLVLETFKDRKYRTSLDRSAWLSSEWKAFPYIQSELVSVDRHRMASAGTIRSLPWALVRQEWLIPMPQQASCEILFCVLGIHNMPPAWGAFILLATLYTSQFKTWQLMTNIKIPDLPEQSDSGNVCSSSSYIYTLFKWKIIIFTKILISVVSKESFHKELHHF